MTVSVVLHFFHAAYMLPSVDLFTSRHAWDVFEHAVTDLGQSSWVSCRKRVGIKYSDWDLLQGVREREGGRFLLSVSTWLRAFFVGCFCFDRFPFAYPRFPPIVSGARSTSWSARQGRGLLGRPLVDALKEEQTHHASPPLNKCRLIMTGMQRRTGGVPHVVTPEVLPGTFSGSHHLSFPSLQASCRGMFVPVLLFPTCAQYQKWRAGLLSAVTLSTQAWSPGLVVGPDLVAGQARIVQIVFFRFFLRKKTDLRDLKLGKRDSC